MLHAFDEVDGVPTIYNGGTGVIPAFRNKGITAAMYRYAIPLLKQQGIDTHLLEVIDNNEPAIKVYEGAGFVKQRKLAAFKSTALITSHLTIPIKPIEVIPSEQVFHSMIPAWQNSITSVERDIEGHHLIGAYQDGVLAGYAAFVPATGRVKQCGVHQAYRSKGIGRALLSYVCKACKELPLVVTNIDESYEPAVRFLEALQFKKILGLYEMKLNVT
jgi:ribosomal protein S18 acetylase RimI-like enzyme